MSTVLPPVISVRMKMSDKDADAPDYVAEDDVVVIEGGAVRQGVLTAEVYGKKSVGLVHATYNTLGPAAVVALLNNTQRLICDWLVLSGFSVGVSDLVIPPEARVCFMLAAARPAMPQRAPRARPGCGWAAAALARARKLCSSRHLPSPTCARRLSSSRCCG
jgi:hypothetical protein